MGYAVKMLADMFSESHPAGALVLRDQTYVDDVGGSNSSFEEARETISQVDKILNSRSFAIKHWNSNLTELDQNPDEVEVDLLGYRWNKREDTLSLKPTKLDFDISFPNLTKKLVMRIVMKFCWDPFGLLLPVTMKYRIALQNI